MSPFFLIRATLGPVLFGLATFVSCAVAMWLLLAFAPVRGLGLVVLVMSPLAVLVPLIALSGFVAGRKTRKPEILWRLTMGGAVGALSVVLVFTVIPLPNRIGFLDSAVGACTGALGALMAHKAVRVTTLVASLFLMVPAVFVATVSAGESTANDKWYAFIYPSFHIKVIDQTGAPVPEALVAFATGTDFGLGSDRAWGKTVTNGAGIAVIRLDGREVDIERVEKDGYHIDFAKTLPRSESSRLYPKDLTRYTHDHPVVIRAWRFRPFRALISGAGHALLRNGEVLPLDLKTHRSQPCEDGTFFCLDTGGRSSLRNRSMWEATDVNLSINDEEAFDAGGLSNTRTFTISVPSGGIVQTDDLYLYSAATTGYSPSWSATYSRESDTHADKGYKFYLVLDNGLRIGRMYLQVRPFYRDGTLVELEYFINPDGETVLDSPLRGVSVNNGAYKRYFNYPSE